VLVKGRKNIGGSPGKISTRMEVRYYESIVVRKKRY